jgi:cytochrome c553
MRTWLLAAGFMFISVAASAQTPLLDRLKSIQSDPVALKAAVEAGRKAAFFCANCHGEEGIGKSAEIPNLAGQNPAFLLEQIRKFGSGERKDPFMQGLIKVLKDDDRLQIALFYASTSVPPSRADSALAAKGKDLFGKLCVRCHGEQARGNAEIPRVAGQKLSYLQTTVTRYRDGTGIRNNQLMTIATAPLKNEDITAVANYLTQLP